MTIGVILTLVTITIGFYRWWTTCPMTTPTWGETMKVSFSFMETDTPAAKAVKRVIDALGDFGTYATGKKAGFIFKVTPGQVPNHDGNIFLVTIQGLHDRAMIKAAGKFGTPRGFHWVVTEDQCVPLAFYPKFANDPDRTEKVTCPETTEEIKFFLKWSGYLGLVTVVRVDGVLVLVTCSKNSVTNKYAKRLDAMVRDWMTYGLACYMADHQVSLAFEVMTKWDATHGARVLQDAMVLTCVATPSQVEGVSGLSYRPEYLSLEEVLAFAKKYGVPHTDLFVVTGVDACRLFCLRLHLNRNEANLDDFYAMCKEVGAEVRSGTVKHEDVLGTCLEGIVAHYYSTDGKKLLTQKLKFVRYVVRTMALRAALSYAWRKHGEFTQEAIQEMVDIITKTVPRWTTCQDAVDVWIHRTLVALDWSLTHWDAYQTDQSETRVGIHIQAFEAITAKEEVDRIQTPSRFDFLVREMKKVGHIPKRKTPMNVIFVVGPSGSGKTTAARKLVSELGGVSVERDSFPLGKQGTAAFRAHLRDLFATEVQLIIVSMTVVYPYALALAKAYGVRTVLVSPTETQEELAPVCQERVLARTGHPNTDGLSNLEVQVLVNDWWIKDYARPAMVRLLESGAFNSVFKESYLGPSFANKILEVLKGLLKKPVMVSPDPKQVDYFHLPVPKGPFQAFLKRRQIDYKINGMHGATLLHSSAFGENLELYLQLLTRPKVVIHIIEIVVTPKGGVAKVRLETPAGETLDHLVASGMPHITLWVSKGIKPVEMGEESLRTAIEEDVSVHQVEDMSFTTNTELVLRR